MNAVSFDKGCYLGSLFRRCFCARRFSFFSWCFFPFSPSSRRTAKKVRNFSSSFSFSSSFCGGGARVVTQARADRACAPALVRAHLTPTRKERQRDVRARDDASTTRATFFRSFSEEEGQSSCSPVFPTRSAARRTVSRCVRGFLQRSLSLESDLATIHRVLLTAL